MKRLFVFLLIFSSINAVSQDYEAISIAFGKGDAKRISSMFATSVDISIVGKEKTVDKNDGEKMLRDFFVEHAPKTFSIVHKGVSSNSVSYMIGEQVTSDETFRITVYLNKKENKYFIQSLEIEGK